ncbi:hypothetical protein [Streptomyces sp. PU-14G]|uniref:hypothetical protein n=1 Tax=Streptomyces sp. PU-14G TaxID=2800808 RepID=UPI0034DE200C
MSARDGGETALDPALFGAWADEPGGAMEASELAFAADGTGRSRLTNAAGADDLTRFRWSCPRPGVLVLREETFSEPGGTAVPVDATVRTAYRIDQTEGRTVLRFDQPVEFAFSYIRVAGELRSASEAAPHTTSPGG